MRLLDDLKPNREYLFALLVLALLVLLIEVTVNGFTSFPDSREYLETVKWFENGTGTEYPLRIQRPLQMVIVAAMSPLLGPSTSFVLANSLFYLLSIPFFFAFSLDLLGDRRLAFSSTILFMGSFAVLYWGLAILTDMLVWLMLSICFYLMMKIRREWKTLDVYLLGATIGIGMLNKESFVAVILIFMFLFAARFGLRSREALKRVAAYLPALLFAVLPFLLVQLTMYLNFGYDATFFGYHLMHKTDIRGELWYLPVTFLIAFNVVPLIYLFGVKRFFRTDHAFGWKEYVVLFGLLFLPVVVFEQYSPRISFIVFPLVLPVAAVGLDDLAGRISKRYGNYLVAAFLVLYLVMGIIASNFGDQLRSLLGIWAR